MFGHDDPETMRDNMRRALDRVDEWRSKAFVAEKDGADWKRRALAAEARAEQTEQSLGVPEVRDFIAGVRREAAYQRMLWDSEHDDGKTPADWFWLVGYLAGKALHAQVSGNTEKALHHTVSTAAALCNWHSAILGKTDMRPGLAAEALPKEVPT